MIGHAAENIDGADVVVVSTAVRRDNPEVAAALERRMPVVPRAEMLGELMRFRHVDRGRRHARQDDDHEPGGQRAGRGRARIRPS